MYARRGPLNDARTMHPLGTSLLGREGGGRGGGGGLQKFLSWHLTYPEFAAQASAKAFTPLQSLQKLSGLP